MKISKLIVIFLTLALIFLSTSTSACDETGEKTKDATVEKLLEGSDPKTIDLIVELAKSQNERKEGDGPFKGIVWADSESTYCDRFVSAVITVATGGIVSEGYQSGYSTAYKHYDVAHKNFIKSGEPPKGAVVYFDKDPKENDNCGHVGIYDGNGYIISVVDKEKGVLILPLKSFEATNLGWITFDDYKGEVKSAAILSPAEEQKTQSGEVTITEVPAPSSPSLTSPYNWYQSLGSAPTLIWKGDENSIYYYVIVNSSNTGDIKSGWISSTSWKPNLPNENYIYSWKVKAKNSQGVESEWSEKRNFSVASTTLKFEGNISFSPPSPSSADRIKIFASTTGWGGVGVTLRVSVNIAPDGSSNGEWKILKELGVPKFNEVDTPEWHTNGWSNGTYRIRVEAKGPDDPNWRNPAVVETTYTLVNKTEKQTEDSNTSGIEDLSFNPTSSCQVGTSVNIHCKATWNEDFRAMRLKINGNIVYELGSPEFNYTWNTSGYSEGGHTVRLEVAAQGDNSWSNPTVRQETYNLTAVNVGLHKPSLSSPSNGALLPPGTDITLVCNSVSGATEYYFEVWGGQYGGTHDNLGGWQSSTSRHIGTMSPGNVLWRVKARNSSGVESPWSDEWNFTPQ